MNLQPKDPFQQTQILPKNYCSQKLQHLYLDEKAQNYVSMTLKKQELVSELLLHREQGQPYVLFQPGICF